MAEPADLLPGTLDMLILKAVSLGALHGYGVLLRIEQMTRGALQIEQGALYPALRALEREKQIVGTWEIQPSGPARRVYAITDAGRKKLAKQVNAWETLVDAVGSVIKGAPHGQPA